jgi:hypothetical protein
MALYVLPNGRKAVNAMENNTIKLRYNVTGSERKLLVAAMGDILVSKPKYLGAPSFAYEVDYFTIDKNGIVSFDDRADSEEIENLIERMQEQGFAAAAADTEMMISGWSSKCHAPPSPTRRWKISSGWWRARTSS